MENAEKCTVTFNGTEVDTAITGWYVDKDINTVSLGDLVKGENVITVTMPIGVRSDIEACYLLGDFAVKCFGEVKKEMGL